MLERRVAIDAVGLDLAAVVVVGGGEVLVVRDAGDDGDGLHPAAAADVLVDDAGADAGPFGDVRDTGQGLGTRGVPVTQPA
jgi:hypothetical protein